MDLLCVYQTISSCPFPYPHFFSRVFGFSVLLLDCNMARIKAGSIVLEQKSFAEITNYSRSCPRVTKRTTIHFFFCVSVYMKFVHSRPSTPAHPLFVFSSLLTFGCCIPSPFSLSHMYIYIYIYMSKDKRQCQWTSFRIVAG